MGHQPGSLYSGFTFANWYVGSLQQQNTNWLLSDKCRPKCLKLTSEETRLTSELMDGNPRQQLDIVILRFFLSESPVSFDSKQWKGTWLMYQEFSRHASTRGKSCFILQKLVSGKLEKNRPASSSTVERLQQSAATAASRMVYCKQAEMICVADVVSIWIIHLHSLPPSLLGLSPQFILHGWERRWLKDTKRGNWLLSHGFHMQPCQEDIIKMFPPSVSFQLWEHRHYGDFLIKSSIVNYLNQYR